MNQENKTQNNRILFTLRLYKSFLNYFVEQFKKIRKEKSI